MLRKESLMSSRYREGWGAGVSGLQTVDVSDRLCHPIIRSSSGVGIPDYTELLQVRVEKQTAGKRDE